MCDLSRSPHRGRWRPGVRLASLTVAEQLREALEAKTPDVLPFRRSVEAVNDLHNRPLQILSDGQAVYLSPMEE